MSKEAKELSALFAIVVMSVAALIIILESANASPKPSRKFPLPPPLPDRIEVISSPLYLEGAHLYVLRDKETEIEFVYAIDEIRFGSLMKLKINDNEE